MLVKHCRICLTKTFRFTCFGSGQDSVKYKMKMCVPEIDFNIISDPVLCESCLKKLDQAYSFKLQCLDIEDKIVDYVKKVRPETLHINLIDVIRMIIDDPQGKRMTNAPVIELSDVDEDDPAEIDSLPNLTVVNVHQSRSSFLSTDQPEATIINGMTSTQLTNNCSVVVEDCMKTDQSNSQNLVVQPNSGPAATDSDCEIMDVDEAASTTATTSTQKNPRINILNKSSRVSKNRQARANNDSDCEVVATGAAAAKSTNSGSTSTYRTYGRKVNILQNTAMTHNKVQDTSKPQGLNLNNNSASQSMAVADTSQKRVQGSSEVRPYVSETRAKTGIVPKDSPVFKKPFGCTKCLDTFESIDLLLKHVKLHSQSNRNKVIYMPNKATTNKPNEV